MRTAIENAIVWDGATCVEPATIHIAEGCVVALDHCAAESGEDIVDGAGCLAIPGLINAHTHLYSALARGMPTAGFAPTSFSEILEGLWWRLDRALDLDAVDASAAAGAIDAARCGVTTVIDHHASPSCIAGSLDAVRGAVGRVGLRAALAYEVSDRDGEDAARAGIKENVRFLSEAGRSDGQFAAHFGLHASFTLSDTTLRRVAASLPDRAGIHIHVAESPEDERLTVDRHGVRVAERLDRYGLLRPPAILVHALHLDEREKDLVAERGAAVVHNPRSNMNNAVGVFDLEGMRRRNALIGLGTDGLGANLLSELFAVSLLQKHVSGRPAAGAFSDLYEMLFAANPTIAERAFGFAFGRIAPGYPADIALLKYGPPTPLHGSNILGHLLFGVAVGGLRVADLFVAGRPVIRNGVLGHVDEDAELAHARETASRLWSRFASGGRP